MDLTLRDAAPLIGRSQRALRAWIARGELPAKKRGGTWWVALADLPLTERQRRSMQQRAHVARDAVDACLPSRAARDRQRQRRSLLDLAAFRAGRDVLHALVAPGPGHAGVAPAGVVALVRSGLLALAEAMHEYHRDDKQAALRRARRLFARASATLLLQDNHPTLQTTNAAIEQDILPAIGGLLRWAEDRRPSQASTRSEHHAHAGFRTTLRRDS